MIGEMPAQQGPIRAVVDGAGVPPVYLPEMLAGEVEDEPVHVFFFADGDFLPDAAEHLEPAHFREEDRVQVLVIRDLEVFAALTAGAAGVRVDVGGEVGDHAATSSAWADLGTSAGASHRRYCPSAVQARREAGPGR